MRARDDVTVGSHGDDWHTVEPASKIREGEILGFRIGALLGAGLEDLTLGVPDEARFTFVFRGERTQLDHALATPALAGGLAGVAIVNDPDTDRASDHAPIVLDLDVLP